MKDYNHIFILYFQGNDDAPRENAEALVAKSGATQDARPDDDHPAKRARIVRDLEFVEVQGQGEGQGLRLCRRARYGDLGVGWTLHGKGLGHDAGHHLGSQAHTGVIRRVSCWWRRQVPRSTSVRHGFLGPCGSTSWKEVTGYTGAVHLNFVRYRTTGKMPEDAVAYKSWAASNGGSRKAPATRPSVTITTKTPTGARSTSRPRAGRLSGVGPASCRERVTIRCLGPGGLDRAPEHFRTARSSL